ncbi:MAG: AAA family ATPase [Candidatus Methanomethylophilaceae archaeon]|nr:AAA family ATPase [Candidatus Methanomethylophilaceae archaeon]
MKHWKDCLSKDYALLIEGARRVGKTTAVKRFVEENYKTSIFIDFSRPPAGIRELIRDGAYDLDRFFLHCKG